MLRVVLVRDCADQSLNILLSFWISVQQLIDKLYLHDQAKGFKLGELRGAWRVDFPLTTLRPSEQPGSRIRIYRD